MFNKNPTKEGKEVIFSKKKKKKKKKKKLGTYPSLFLKNQ